MLLQERICDCGDALHWPELPPVACKENVQATEKAMMSVSLSNRVGLPFCWDSSAEVRLHFADVLHASVFDFIDDQPTAFGVTHSEWVLSVPCSLACLFAHAVSVARVVLCGISQSHTREICFVLL